MTEQQRFQTHCSKGNRQPGHKHGEIISLLVFIIGATTMYDITVIARIPLSETLLLASIPFLMIKRIQPGAVPRFTKILGIILLLGIGITLSDLLNQNIGINYAKSIAKPLFILLHLVFWTNILRLNPLSLPWYVYGTVFASLYSYFNPSSYIAENLNSEYEYTVYFVMPFVGSIFFSVAVFLYLRNRVLSVLSLVCMTIILYSGGGTRNSVYISCLTICFILVYKLKSEDSRRLHKLISGKLLLVGIALLLISGLLYAFYLSLGQKGFLPSTSQRRYDMQTTYVSGGSLLDLVAVGRTEVLGAIFGIKERPLFGFGSWRNDLTEPFYHEALAYVGLPIPVYSSAEFITAGHSIFFQSWLENGFIPALCYLAIIILAWKGFLKAFEQNMAISPYLTSLIFGLTWDLLFSPFSTSTRFEMGLFLAFWISGPGADLVNRTIGRNGDTASSKRPGLRLTESRPAL